MEFEIVSALTAQGICGVTIRKNFAELLGLTGTCITTLLPEGDTSSDR